MAKGRFKLIPAVHLFLVRDEKILLLRRFNTGYEDGNYSVVAGHLDGGETATSAVVREAMEEADIAILPRDLRLVHTMHRIIDDERVDFFFEATNWSGKVKNVEPHKCDGLRWFSLDKLPHNVIPYVKRGIDSYVGNILYSEFLEGGEL